MIELKAFFIAINEENISVKYWSIRKQNDKLLLYLPLISQIFGIQLHSEGKLSSKKKTCVLGWLELNFNFLMLVCQWWIVYLLRTERSVKIRRWGLWTGNVSKTIFCIGLVAELWKLHAKIEVGTGCLKHHSLNWSFSFSINKAKHIKRAHIFVVFYRNMLLNVIAWTKVIPLSEGNWTFPSTRDCKVSQIILFLCILAYC